MTDRTIRLSMREHLRHQVIQKVVSGGLTEKEAAERLRLSTRQIRRLKKRVMERGPSGVLHRLRGRESNRRLDPALEREIVRLYDEEYRGWNMTHFAEFLAREHGIEISREKARQLLHQHPDRPKRNQRRRHRRWRERRTRRGELVQLDTSIHDWLGADGEKVVLISAIDDATSRVLCSEFFASDGTLENLSLVKSVARKHGIPESLYVDQASKFFLLEEDLAAARERGEEGLTQFGRVMKHLGIEMIRARSPQAKGRIERSFRTFQDRLVKELSRHVITTMDEANKYLRQVYLPDHNRRFSHPPAESDSAFVKMQPGTDYNAIFCLRETRVVQNDCTIQYAGTRYQLAAAGLRSRQRVELRTWLNGSLHAYWKGQPIALRPIERKAG